MVQEGKLALWHALVIPAPQGAEAGGSQDHMDSLTRSCLKIKSRKGWGVAPHSLLAVEDQESACERVIIFMCPSQCNQCSV